MDGVLWGQRLCAGVLVSSLVACGSLPMSSEAFRALAREGHAELRSDGFVVNRSLADVGTSLERLAKACLQLRADTRAVGLFNTGGAHPYATSTPVVRATPQRVELSLQLDYKATTKVRQEPEGGFYILVAEAVPEGPRRTRVDVYRARAKSDTLFDALKGWASGETLACPDPASFM